MTPADTRERLLEAAERHFSEHGFAGASLRQVTAEARANLAAVSYHFGSKEDLFVAVVARLMAPINQERLGLLDQAEARAGKSPLEVEELLEILIGPVLRARTSGGCTLRLFARSQFEDPALCKRIVDGPLKEIKPRIEAALARTLPYLSRQELAYRLHFTMGAVKSAAGDQHMLRAFSRGLCDPGDIEGTLREIVAFLAGAMRAPSVSSPRASARVPSAARGKRKPTRSKERSS